MTIHLTPEESAQYLADFDVHCAPHREGPTPVRKENLRGDEPWMVAVSNTSCERRATQGLVDAGFEVWWPTRIVEARNRYTKRTTFSERPLYGGYLFVRQHNALDWQVMYGIDGIKTVLLNDNRPLRIADEIMQQVRRDAQAIADAKPGDVIEVGDEVVILHGPFAGLRTSVTRIIGLSAVGVALGMFGGSVATSVALGDVEKVA